MENIIKRRGSKTVCQCGDISVKQKSCRALQLGRDESLIQEATEEFQAAQLQTQMNFLRPVLLWLLPMDGGCL